MERMLSKDKQPFGERPSDTGFWIPYYDTGDDGMARLVKVEQRFNPFWSVPKAPDGLGSFLVGQVKTRPVQRRKERSDKTGYYETWEFQVATKVQLEPGGRFTDIIFNVQDMIIGQTINDRFPVIPGQVTTSPVGKWIALAYLRANEKGYHDPDMFLGDTLEEVLSDLHAECRPMALQLMGQGIDSTWEYSHAAWTPSLAEFLANKGVKDDIPF